MDADFSAAYADTFERVARADERPAPTAPDVVYSVERFAAIADEIQPLLARHWAELALNRDIVPLDPDFERYRAIDEAGIFRVYTARLAGRLAGYAAYIVGINPHYRTLRIATADLFWLAPEHRGQEIGRGLFQFVETSLRAEGVDGMYTTSKLAHPAAARLLESLGHAPIEVAHAKLFRRA